MTDFQFIMSNQGALQDILKKLVDGELFVDPDEFDFSHKDLDYDNLNGRLGFSIEIGPGFKIRTIIAPEEFHKFSSNIKMIKDHSIQIMLVEVLEDTYQVDAQDEIDRIEDDIQDLKKSLIRAESTSDSVAELTRIVKQEWGIK